MKKALIVSHHSITRLAMKILLKQADMEVTAETNSFQEAEQKARDLSPDLVLLNIEIPNSDGFQLLKRLRSLSLPMKILVLTSQASIHFSQRYQLAGADGIVNKTDNLNDITAAIRLIMRGYNFFPHCNKKSNSEVDGENKIISNLSDRELCVLILISSGMRNNQIANHLLLSEKTISTYKHRLKKKLNAHSLVELLDFARRNELTSY